jgi:hypothetical protein
VRNGFAAFFLAFAWNTIAWAEPTAADRTNARAELDQGYALLGKHDPAAALKHFLAADAIMNVPSTKLAVAQARVPLHQLVEATDDLDAALRMPSAAHESAGLKKAREDCAKLLAEITPRLAELTVTLSGSAEVRVDGSVIPAAALGTSRRLNPGPHKVEVVGGATQDLVLEEGEKKSLALTAPAAVAPPPPPPPPPAKTTEPRPSSRRPWEIGGFALGGAGIAMGSIAGLVAIGAEARALDEGCVNDRCPPPAHGDVDEAKRWATISTVAFAIGLAGVALAVGAIVWPSDQKP